MRIHTDTLKGIDLMEAARISGADIDYTRHDRSRIHDHSYDVTLSGTSRRRPNRRGNHGPDEYAATWDQWGVFLAVLFERDESMFCGSGTKYAIYRDGEHFADKTADRFGAPEDVMTLDGYRRRFVAYGWPADAHGDHTFRFSRIGESKCTKCSAVQRWQIGE